MSRRGGRGTAGVGVASLVAALSGYAVLVLAGALLPGPEEAAFLVFWGLLFLFSGTLVGLQSEATRSVHVRADDGPDDGPDGGRDDGPRVVVLGLLVGLGLAAALVATAPLWAARVLGAGAGPAVAALAVGVVGFAGYSALTGALAGRGAWRPYAVVVGSEPVVRLVLAALVALGLLGDRVPLGLRAAAAGAALTWAALCLHPAVRAGLAQRAGPARPFLAASAQAMLGTASSAALVVGFPVLLRVTTAPGEFAAAGPLLYAVILTRAPLLLPLYAYQGVALTWLLDHPGGRAVLRLAGLVLGVGAVGAVAAAVVGPWATVLLLGPGSRVDGLVLGLLTLAAALLALLVLSGTAVLALGGHRAYAAGWLVATAGTLLVLLVPGDLAARAVASLAAGPLLGLAVHAGWVRAALRRRAGGPPAGPLAGPLAGGVPRPSGGPVPGPAGPPA